MFRNRNAYADQPASSGSGSAAVGSGRLQAARIIGLIGLVVALIIVAGILLKVLGANPSNDIVSAVVDVAEWLVGPFRGIFSFDNNNVQLGVNWGIAAVVYLAISQLIARLVAP